MYFSRADNIVLYYRWCAVDLVLSVFPKLRTSGRPTAAVNICPSRAGRGFVPEVRGTDLNKTVRVRKNGGQERRFRVAEKSSVFRFGAAAGGIYQRTTGDDKS